MFLEVIRNRIKENRKLFALLIDPDKHTTDSLLELLCLMEKSPGPDLILVGGSLLLGEIHATIQLIKKHTDRPVFIFPGNSMQISSDADGILFLSLISGRNAEFLIGNHVVTAPKIKRMNIEVIPTGYMLVNAGSDTSVSYMSNTVPIPYLKNDIAIATAIAGEMLGLKLLYLEAGSGALKPVSPEMIAQVKRNTNLPLIVGGGIKTEEQLKATLAAGADIVVIGNGIENDTTVINRFSSIISGF